MADNNNWQYPMRIHQFTPSRRFGCRNIIRNDPSTKDSVGKSRLRVLEEISNRIDLANLTPLTPGDVIADWAWSDTMAKTAVVLKRSGCLQRDTRAAKKLKLPILECKYHLTDVMYSRDIFLEYKPIFMAWFIDLPEPKEGEDPKDGALIFMDMIACRWYKESEKETADKKILCLIEHGYCWASWEMGKEIYKRFRDLIQGLLNNDFKYLKTTNGDEQGILGLPILL